MSDRSPARLASSAPAPAGAPGRDPEILDAAPQEDPLERMAREVRASLSASPRWIPSKYFYDDRGGALFDEITRLPEYYPTRTEAAILEACADEVAREVRPRELFELGSGSGVKTRRIVEAARRVGSLERLTFFDVHASVLASSLRAIGADAPGLALRGWVGDFGTDLAHVPPEDDRLALFLGGTIGNLDPADEVPALLAAVRGLLGARSAFLLGVDLEKDPAELHAAYNDSRGVTADFNRNILRVVNARLRADFVPERFEHVAFYDRERRWIEMRLRATEACRVRVRGAGLDLSIEKGEEIRTEISCKYTRASLESRLSGAGLAIERWFTDARSRFAVALLRPA
jgi:L-histidine N-alpha-methyltransferase